MNKLMIAAVLIVALICSSGWMLSGNSKIVGTDIKESDFKEFYYTYSSTVNPPKFYRYRIYTDNGKRMFYHEKREGNKVFLTEEDITVSGRAELTAEEWKIFWNYISDGTVESRKESTTSGGAGPWLYLYWSGDKNKCQEFTFANAEKKTGFEEFCARLKAR